MSDEEFAKLLRMLSSRTARSILVLHYLYREGSGTIQCLDLGLTANTFQELDSYALEYITSYPDEVPPFASEADWKTMGDMQPPNRRNSKHFWKKYSLRTAGGKRLEVYVVKV